MDAPPSSPLSTGTSHGRRPHSALGLPASGPGPVAVRAVEGVSAVASGGGRGGLPSDTVAWPRPYLPPSSPAEDALHAINSLLLGTPGMRLPRWAR